MNRYAATTLALLLLLVANPSDGRAEIKQVQMKIAGYLCGM
ncbi:MAG TPA: hypothetical protein VKA70_07290 [Blastocatellia bacterium]|nr:hypothetical protein [Blastocatellia bacterium]